jgi:hypothetical protein
VTPFCYAQNVFTFELRRMFYEAKGESALA